MVDVIDRLRTLPPKLEQPSDRFEQIRARVMRNRRKQAVMGATVATVVVAGVLVSSALPGLWTATTPNIGTHPDQAPSQPPSLHTVLPGGTRVINLSKPRSATGTGSTTIQLGQPPFGATMIATSVQCLSPGTFGWPDGARLKCMTADVNPQGHPTTTYRRLKMQPGQDTLTLKATPDMKWRIRTQFVRTQQVPWGINGNGQTYGVSNTHGDPDLVAVAATNGQTGYVYASQLNARANDDKTRTIPVYKSDGKTKIGHFTVNPHSSRSTVH